MEVPIICFGGLTNLLLPKSQHRAALTTAASPVTLKKKFRSFLHEEKEKALQGGGEKRVAKQVSLLMYSSALFGSTGNRILLY